MFYKVDISALLLDQNPWWNNPNHRETRGFPFRRAVFLSLLPYVSDPRELRAALLIGPRQVGKTTLLRQLVDELLDRNWPPGNIMFFDFADERLVDAISPREVATARPSGMSDEHPRVLLLDEIQYAPGWSRWLKSAVDQARRTGSRIRFIVTGSAASALRDGAIESGQGRWDELQIEGLTFSEFLSLSGRGADDPGKLAARDPQAFDRYLALGGLPGHANSVSPRASRRRIREDVAERAILRDLRGTGVEIEQVRRLFVHLVAGSGGEWNQSNRADDLGANRKSLGDWLALLESTHLLVRLNRDRTALTKARSDLRSRPKIFAADHGLIAAFSPYPEPLQVTEVLARVYEAIVFRHLRDLARKGSGELSFFRLNDDIEVDFVLRYPRSAVGVEVTSSSNLKPSKIARAAEGMQRAGIERKLLIHGGVTMTHSSGVALVPLHEFLLDPSRHAGAEP